VQSAAGQEVDCSITIVVLQYFFSPVPWFLLLTPLLSCTVLLCTAVRSQTSRGVMWAALKT
jgi:hypothetical protein